MLHPDSTVLLTEALRPPAGFEVDQAVATTYSLTLTAMLLAPMTFALSEVDDASGRAATGPVDTVQLLDAVERHIGHTTVFVQAGGIHVPETHSRIHTFLEDSIHEVLPPTEGRLFHPKLWAIRFIDDAGGYHHRVAILSRNLTLDDSWDTVLTLDEDPGGSISAEPVAEFIHSITKLTTQNLPASREKAVTQLANSLCAVKMKPPAPFTSGYLLPLGLDDSGPWPFPANPQRVLAISPFLNASTLSRIRSGSSDAIVVSRPEALDLIGRRCLWDWTTTVLNRGVEEISGDATPARVVDEYIATDEQNSDRTAVSHSRLAGLHAKTTILDLPDNQSMVVTGSANLTSHAWNGGVEMNAVLFGPTNRCGVQAVLGDENETLGLQSILEPYTPAGEEGQPDPAIATSLELETFHRDLARHRPRLEVTSQDERVSVRLDLTLPRQTPGVTRVWLVTVPEQSQELASQHRWQIAPENVTPFLAVETTAGEGDARVTRRCVLMMRIVGDPIDRRRAVLSYILSSRQGVLIYLALLLGMDPVSTDKAELNKSDVEGIEAVAASDGPPQRPEPSVVLFEPLIRATGNDPKSLSSIARQIDELRQMPNADDVIPEEFLHMWDVVLKTVQSRRVHKDRSRTGAEDR